MDFVDCRQMKNIRYRLEKLLKKLYRLRVFEGSLVNDTGICQR